MAYGVETPIIHKGGSWDAAIMRQLYGESELPLPTYTTPQPVETEGLANAFIGFVNGTFADVSFTIFQNFSKAFTEILFILALLTAISFAYFSYYRAQELANMPWKIVVAMLVCAFMYKDDGLWMISNVWYYFTEWPLDIMGYFASVGSTFSSESLLDGVDTNLSVMGNVAEQIWGAVKFKGLFGQGEGHDLITNLELIVASIITSLVYGAVYIKFIFNIVVAQGAIYLVIAVSGPIIMLSIFDWSRKFVFNLFRICFQYSLTMIFSGLILGMFTAIIETAAQAFIEKLSAEQRDWSVLVSTDFAAILLGGIILFFLLGKASEIASMLTTAVASNSSGFGDTIKKFIKPWGR